MRLKKLTILGFKSFADKTVLHFDAGITCIVGPNGCGKSNIADAFRWVLGEQSAKSMRGTKMPDIIFAGTTHRKPLNIAEVSLTLTDLQGALPIDYEEITITRRLQRNGDSDYLLNGNSIRLKDLQTLFLGSGIGKNAFSIFEQGKLDQIISFTPLERRYIFEEAAGILRFLQRKKEALKRLEQADLNLSRVKDIHLEVESQIQILEKQAEKARVFKEQKKSLEELEKASYVLKWQGLKKKQGDLENKEKQQQQLLNECQQHYLIGQERAQEAKQSKQKHEGELRSQHEKLLTARNQQEIQSRECQSLQQRIKEADQRKKKLKQELEELGLAHEARQKTLSELISNRQQLESKWSDAEIRWIDQQNLVKVQEKTVIQLRQESSVKQQAYLKCLQQNNQSQSELKQLEIRMENGIEQQKKLDSFSQKLKGDLLQSIQMGKEKKQHLQQLSEIIDTHKNRLEHYEGEIKRLVKEGEEKLKEIDHLRRKTMEMKARQKVLLRMREEHEGFSSGSKRLLQETENPHSPVYQMLRPLYEYFKPEAEAVEALAVVLRHYSQTLVVEQEQNFLRVISFAEQAGLQDYSLVCVDRLRRLTPSPSSEGSLLSKVSINLLSQHFLENVRFENSPKEPTEEISSRPFGLYPESWSLEGFFVDHHGVLFKTKPNENQVFFRESELQNLENELVGMEAQLKTWEESLQQVQQQSSQLKSERIELDQLLRRDEMKLVEVNFGLQRALSDQEKNKKDQANCEQELAALTQHLQQQTDKYQSLSEEFGKLKQELIQLQQEKEVLQHELNLQENVLRNQEKEQKEKGNVYQHLAQNRQNVLHQYNLLEIKEQEHEKNVRRIEKELAEWQERQENFQNQEKKALECLALFETEGRELAKQYSEMEKQSECLLQACDQADQQLLSQRGELKHVENLISQLHVQLAHQQAASQALEGELSERYDLMMEEALQSCSPLPRSLEQTEKQMRELRQCVQECGDVNLTAIDDLEKYQQRDHFLKQQIGDMQHSKEELLGLIEQLDGESHHLFRETFEAIRLNFKKNFQILFNGGEADLELTDSTDILEAGIEISAKPPGKQMRSISLLSGGEKCLTAVALLFAIFEVKPAPFCILDEIDAPLDDANVERFVNVVKHFVNRCQFLIITHNKRTMAIGDILFGVSMEEKGVSKLLTLEFAKREAPEASMISC